MITSLKDMIRFKANDNAPEPVIRGDFAKDAIRLSAHWGQTDKQFYAWAACPAQFSQAMIAAGYAVQMGIAPALPDQRSRDTAMALATINVLFATLKGLPDAEAMFILNHLTERQTGFVDERAYQKQSTTN